MRWSKSLGKPVRSDDEWKPAELLPHTQNRGFAEAMTNTAALIARPRSARDEEPDVPSYDDVPDERHLEFPSEGPQGHRERMRKRVLERGAESLADYELLEMLLFLIQPLGDTKRLAKRLINQFGSYGNTLVAAPTDLLAVPGVGPTTVAILKFMREGAVRLAREEVLNQPVLNNWEELMKYLNSVMAREKVEQFRILFLDTKHRLICDELQAKGTINHTPVYVREVAKRALDLHAAGIILSHNHPSGDPTPSMADLDMTTEIQRVLKSLSVVLHDHVIVGNGKYVSLRKEGFL